MKCAECPKLKKCPISQVWGCRFPEKEDIRDKDIYPMETRIKAIADDIIGQLVAESVNIQTSYTESKCFVAKILNKWDKELKKVAKQKANNE